MKHCIVETILITKHIKLQMNLVHSVFKKLINIRGICIETSMREINK